MASEQRLDAYRDKPTVGATAAFPMQHYVSRGRDRFSIAAQPPCLIAYTVVLSERIVMFMHIGVMPWGGCLLRKS